MNTRTSIPIINTTDVPQNREAYPRRYRQPTARFIEGRNPVYRRFRHSPLGQGPQALQPQLHGQEEQEEEGIELVEGDLDDNGNGNSLVELGESSWLEFADENNPVVSEDDPQTRPIMDDSSVYWVSESISDDKRRRDERWKKMMEMVGYASW